MRFTIDDNHLIKWMWVKKLRRKTLAQDVFDRSWSLDGVKTLIKKYQCEIFNFVDLCSGVGIVWSTTTRTRVSDATAVTFSVKCFDPWKLLSFVRKHLQKAVCFILFIYSRAFHNNVIFNGKSYCCDDIFTDVQYTSLLAKNIWEEYKLFLCC